MDHHGIIFSLLLLAIFIGLVINSVFPRTCTQHCQVTGFSKATT